VGDDDATTDTGAKKKGSRGKTSCGFIPFVPPPQNTTRRSAENEEEEGGSNGKEKQK
jgi:hypothetical protein